MLAGTLSLRAVGVGPANVLSQMQHPLLAEERPNRARQSLATTLSAPLAAATSYCHPGRHANAVTLEGILKRYPEIGDCPEEGSIEPSRRFYRTPDKVLSNSNRFYRTPFWAPKRFNRTPVRGTSEPQTGFYRTFRIEPPFLGYPFKILPIIGQPASVHLM